MKKLLFLLVAVFALASCDKGNDPENKAIEVENGQTNQVVWADNTEGKGGVTFKTTGAWTSTITETTSPAAQSTMSMTKAGAPDWVSIDPASGDKAGSYTINITLSPNFTGSKRTATIHINCNGSTITITVSQDGKTETGEIPNDHVTGISLNKTILTLCPGENGILIATILPVNATNQNIIWTSGNTEVATVSNKIPQEGSVFAQSLGTTEITATTEDGAKVAKCTVQVQPFGSGVFNYSIGNQSFIIDKAKQELFYFSRPDNQGGGGWNSCSLTFYNGNKIVQLPTLITDAPSVPITARYVGREWNGIPPAGTFATKTGNMYSFNGTDYCAVGGTIIVTIEQNIYTVQVDIDTSSERGGNGNFGKITGSYIGKIAEF